MPGLYPRALLSFLFLSTLLAPDAITTTAPSSPTKTIDLAIWATSHPSWSAASWEVRVPCSYNLASGEKPILWHSDSHNSCPSTRLQEGHTT